MTSEPTHPCPVDGCTATWRFHPNRHLIHDHGFCRVCVKQPHAPGQEMCQACIDRQARNRAEQAVRERRERVARIEREPQLQWAAIRQGRDAMHDWTLTSWLGTFDPASRPVARAVLGAVEPWIWAHVGHRFSTGRLVPIEEDDPELPDEHPIWDHFFGDRRKPGLFIYGGVGSTKTGFAWSLVRLKVERKYGYERPHEYPAFANVVELLDECKANMRTGDGGAPVRRLYDASLLVLDDLGAERPTDWARDAIAALVQHRHTRALPTIVTSNYAPSALAQRLGHDDLLIGKRIVSRLTENCIKVKLDRRDLRLKSVAVAGGNGEAA